MASRRFFAYDPYDYYYAAPYQYAPPYYYRPHQPRGDAGLLFPAAEPVKAAPAPAVEGVRPRGSAGRSVSIPVHFVGAEEAAEREAVRRREREASAEEAAVRVQAAARGFLARRWVRAVREVEREAEEAAARVAREAEALRGDARARVAVGEALMRLLLRLDAVRGAREYRRKVTRRVLALQDAVDALEPRPAPAARSAEAAEEAPVEMAEESAMPAPELPDAAGHGDGPAEEAAAFDMAAESAAGHGGETEARAAAEMEVDEGSPAAEVIEAEEKEAAPAPEAAHAGGGITETEEAGAEGEWEMVTEEPEEKVEAPRAPEPAGEKAAGTAGGEGGGVEARRVMEMVAALCERSAQQCAVMGALAERVEALERAVRRVEEAERRRRRRRGKKLRKDGKAGGGGHHAKCYSE
ncbi:hypothetical protein ACP4OV_009065 [Aristida adscensionis]